MSIQNYAFTPKKIAVNLLTATLMILSVSTHSQAQLNPGFQVSVRFPKVADRGAPKRTEGSGVRGGCDAGDKDSVKLMAIAPDNNVITSVNPDPTIYVYSSIVNKQVEFQVFELNPEKDIDTQKFSLPNSPGIVKVKLPKTLQLAENKIYGWRFTVKCESTQRDADKFVVGRLEKKTLTQQQLTNLHNLQDDLLSKAKLYAKYGIWHETVEILANSQGNHLFKSAWEELLESVGIKEFAQYSVNYCCQVADSSTIQNRRNRKPDSPQQKITIEQPKKQQEQPNQQEIDSEFE
ncbi:MAG: DUF928 domain-containing protein [Sphaerospermopsis sp. SIO1G1]|nr:DUF928 domain-containing protein [Sphaerospermopsis sp. SIO1G1]